MTCTEYYDLSLALPWNITRAERAAIFVHLVKCKDCRNYHRSLPKKHYTKKQHRLLNYLAVRDGQDPEVADMITALPQPIDYLPNH
jgi:hypothetical protein